MLFYRALSVIFLPAIYLYLLFRLLNNKEDCSRFKERLGFAGQKRPDGDIFWIHCVSVGESNSAMILVEKILEQYNDVHLLFTSTTLTSADQIQGKLGANQRIIHQFLPIDDVFSVNRFVKYWSPKKAIFFESEIWPNFIYSLTKNNIHLSLVNARISHKSYQMWLRVQKVGFNIFKNFQICFAQSQLDKDRFIQLGIKNTKFIGNLKACAKKLSYNKKDYKSLLGEIGSRKFWFVASTHKGEEDIIIDVHQKLKKYIPDILTIIAPRHPSRMEQIKKIIPKDITFAIRSKNESIKKHDLYFVDTIGELGLFYKLSDISLIAGSLIDKIGGHNPFEALNLDSVIISGSYIKNFEEVYKDLVNENSCIIIKDSSELLYYVLRLLQDGNFRDEIRDNWKKVAKDNENMVLEVLKSIW